MHLLLLRLVVWEQRGLENPSIWKLSLLLNVCGPPQKKGDTSQDYQIPSVDGGGDGQSWDGFKCNSLIFASTPQCLSQKLASPD
jgi:hypothetical protein